MTTYYKATQVSGLSFHGPHIDYGAALVSGAVIRHPSKVMIPNDAATYLSVATVPTDCIGFEWPCRLFRVEPQGDVLGWACLALRVVEELPAWQVFGPQGQQVVAVFERAARLTPNEAKQLVATQPAAWAAARAEAWNWARDAQRGPAWDAAWGAVWDRARAWAEVWAAAWDRARDAARGYVVRDLITEAQFGLLAGPWLSVIGATE